MSKADSSTRVSRALPQHAKTGRAGDPELDMHVKDVLDQLDAKSAAFEQLSRDLGGTMELLGFFKKVEPGFALERELVERMARYALTLDCDFYNCRR